MFLELWNLFHPGTCADLSSARHREPVGSRPIRIQPAPARTPVPGRTTELPGRRTAPPLAVDAGDHGDDRALQM